MTARYWFILSIFYYALIFIGRGVCDIFLIKIENPMLILYILVFGIIAAYFAYRFCEELENEE